MSCTAICMQWKDQSYPTGFSVMALVIFVKITEPEACTPTARPAATHFGGPEKFVENSNIVADLYACIYELGFFLNAQCLCGQAKP